MSGSLPDRVVFVAQSMRHRIDVIYKDVCILLVEFEIEVCYVSIGPKKELVDQLVEFPEPFCKMWY
jgi:hypothetical protein